MKSLFVMLIYTIFIFSDTYVSGNIIFNSSNVGEKGSGMLINKTVIPKKMFNKINIDIASDIIINKSSKNRITIRTDDNLIDKVLVYVKDSTLFIKANGNFNPSKGLLITINSKLLDELDIYGASDITVRDYQLNSLSLNIDGASDILFNSNKINRLNITADGSYDINLLKSVIGSAYIKADGSGSIDINIEKYMDISVSGTVEVKYIGNPKIKKNIDGVAELIKIR